MTCLNVIIKLHGEPAVEFAAAARVPHGDYSQWIGFHTLIYHKKNEASDDWSRRHIYGIPESLCVRWGQSLAKARWNFIGWLKRMVAYSGAKSIIFLSPQENKLEKALFENWNVVSMSNLYYSMQFACNTIRLYYTLINN